MSVRIGAVDDHPAILEGVMAGLAHHLPDTPDITIATSVTEFLAQERECDLVLLDLGLGDGRSPGENVRQLIAAGHDVLLYTQETRPRPVAAALQAGAKGIVGKHQPLAALAEAILEVAGGGVHLSQEWAAALETDAERIAPQLSARELEALQLYAAGLPLKSVAKQMFVGQETVRVYLLRVRAKYETLGRPAATKTDLYIRAIEDGFLPSPDVG